MRFKAVELKEGLNHWNKCIKKFPNIRYLGHPDLRKRCEIVGDFDSTTKKQITILKKTLLRFRKETGFGRGIAAPQIGIFKRIVTIYDGENVIVLINPKITKISKELAICEELCMSFGNLSATVVRPKFITVKYQDEKGSQTVIEADEKSSRMIQHEIDHLDGILNIDRAIKNGLRFVYSMKQFNGIHDLDIMGDCPCGSGEKYKKCCG